MLVCSGRRRLASTAASTTCTPFARVQTRHFAVDSQDRTHFRQERPRLHRPKSKIKVLNTPAGRHRFFEHDLISKDNLLQKFINHMMKAGKKEYTEAVVYDALKLVKLRLRNERENELLASLRDSETSLVNRLLALSPEERAERAGQFAHLPEKARFHAIMLSLAKPDNSLGPLRSFCSPPKPDTGANDAPQERQSSQAATPPTRRKLGKVEYVSPAPSGEADLLDQDSLEIFATLMQKVTPQMGILRKYGGGRASSVFTVPVPLTTQQGGYHACRFVIHSARVRTERSMLMRLANEFLDIHRGSARSLIERQNMHKLALENRGMSHLAG